MATQQTAADTRATREWMAAGLELLRAGDIEGSLADWADDCTVTLVGAEPIDPGHYTGKDEVRAWMNTLHEGHFEIEEEIVSIEGNTVTVRARTWTDTTRRLGVAPLEATEVFVLAGRKIKSLVWTITPGSLERLRAALAATSRP